MSGVDLVPDEFKIGHQRHRRIRYWMALILVVCCAAGVVSGAKYLVYLREDRAAQEIAADYDELQRDIEHLNRERTQLNSWQNQLALIQELGHYVDYVELTSFLAQNTPRLIYLETMDFVSPDPIQSKSSSPPPLPKGAQMFMLKETASASPARDTHSSVNMFLRGRAFQYQAVADYLTILRATPYFEAVDLKRTWRPQGNSMVESESIQFEIQCRILPMRIRKGVQYATMPQTQNF